MTKQDEEIARLKEEYINYYSELPVQKYAAMYIGRDEETIMRWRKKDVDFRDRVQKARADWVKSKTKKAKVEFALERVEKEIFNEKITHEHEGNIFAGGKVTFEVINEPKSKAKPKTKPGPKPTE